MDREASVLQSLGSQRVRHNWGIELNWTELMLNLKLQYFSHLMQRADSLEKKTLMLGKIEGKRTKGQWRMKWLGWHHWLNGHEFEQTQGDGEGQGSLVCCIPWGHKESDMTERLNWTELILFTNSYWDLFWEFYYLSQSRNVIWPIEHTGDIFL